MQKFTLPAPAAIRPILMILLGMLLGLSAVSGAGAAATAPTTSTTGTVGATGTSGTVPTTGTEPVAKRVVSLSPNITESIFAIGASERLVGVSDFCHFPAEAEKIRHCGGWSNPNFEVVSAQHPDLILALGESQKIQAYGRERGITVRAISMDSEATICAGLQELGRRLGHVDGATSLTGRIKAELDGLRKEMEKTPPARRPLVFISIGRTAGSLAGIMTAAHGGFLDEAITLAGGRNAFGELKQYYPQVSKESILMRRPDIILELTGGNPLTDAQRAQMVNDWKALPSLPAVRDGRVIVLPDQYLLIPGPRLPQIVRAFREVIAPKGK